MEYSAWNGLGFKEHPARNKCDIQYFFYELRDPGFESRYIYINFKYHACYGLRGALTFMHLQSGNQLNASMWHGKYT